VSRLVSSSIGVLLALTINIWVSPSFPRFYETRLADDLEDVDNALFHPIDPVAASVTVRISF